MASVHSAAKKAKTSSDDLPVCPYGEKCYRKNPEHFKEYSHTFKDGWGFSIKTKAPASKRIDTAKLPVCEYGANCYRKNLLHFAEYSHPTAGGTSHHDADTGNDDDDTDEYDSDDETKKDGDEVDCLLGKKTYSVMTEQERKELIQKAFEAKWKVENELKETKEQMNDKNKELTRLQNEVSTGMLLMDGEKEAIEGHDTVYFKLKPERGYKEGSAAQIHFRLAESQFYRLLGMHGSHWGVVDVDYVVNPKLVKRFRTAREKMTKVRGEKLSEPVLAFHGTSQANISKICENGFLAPGDKNFAHKTDTGYYGAGVYFSEFPDLSIGYVQGADTRFLLSQVLLGKVYECPSLMQGAGLMDGYDTHMSPSKQELIVFNTHCILPTYIVHYMKKDVARIYKSGPSKTVSGTELSEKYIAAQKVKKSNILSGWLVQFCGKFADTQKNLMKLAIQHGAMAGTNASFTLLFYDGVETEGTKPEKVQKAQTLVVDVVAETYLYDCITSRKMLDITDYEYN